VLQPDVARVGGITPWLKVAHLAEAFNMMIAPHFLMELHLSLAAAVPNGRWVEWIPQLSPLTTAPMTAADGWAVPPSLPGIGISWDRSAIDALRFERQHVPQEAPI
jgi:L-alanine-DL-glutamate epimerase-like enolase superfamily enzyme